MNFLPLILSILIAQTAGFIGSVFTITSVSSWYETINKPAWNPPSWIFSPVWITLYTLMGIAAYLVWRERKNKGRKTALTVYGIHLGLNSLWSILFFGFQNPGIAFGEILVLLTLIIITTILFWRINKWAGILLIPYIAWVSFATILNFTIWQLN